MTPAKTPDALAKPAVHTPTMFAAGICVRLAADPSESNISPAEFGSVTVALLPAANIVGVCTSGLTKTGGFGGTNTPAFSVYRSGTQAIANNTATKVQYNTESFDTDNTFDSSTNYRYTPAFSGKSFLVGSIRLYGTDDFNNYTLEIHKNGTAILRQQNSHWHYESAQVSGIVTHDTNDYFEVFVMQQSGSSLVVMSGSPITYFMGYKLIE